MNPYQETHKEWQEGVYFQKELTAEEKGRLVHYGQTSPPSPDTGFIIYRAKLDGETVLAVVPKGEEPTDNESQTLLGWTKVIPTGRKNISIQEHRECVETALLLDKEVPQHVLATYPELMSQQGNS